MRPLWQPSVFSLILCTAASVGGGCGSKKSASPRDAAIVPHVPAGTGGSGAGGATGGSLATGGAGGLDGAAVSAASGGAAGGGGGAVDAGRADVSTTGGVLPTGGSGGKATGGMSGSATSEAIGTGGASAKGGSSGTGGAIPGPLVTLVGTYTSIGNPCNPSEPCVPGMVAAIETASDTIILLIDGFWIMDGSAHFNGFRYGEALELVGYYPTIGNSAIIGIEVVSMKHIVEWGSGGAGGGNATGGAGGAVPDPGTGGPPMVRMPEGFFIDTTEVTRGQYEAWLATNPATSNQIEECETNTTFAPECGDTSPCQGDDCSRPQVCVDWCDAFQYCQAVGKRLCGSLSQDPTQSEWVVACSAHGNNLWVYGNDYDPPACNVPELRLRATTPVGSMTGCQSTVPRYEGVYDLIGNVYEWQSNCVASSCDVRGGSYDLIGRSDMQDRCTDYITRLRSVNRTDIGFRCCAS